MSFTIAIVGRPNVGKSTLFNRLVGRRLALVDDTPGVTRDRREGEAHLGDLTFTVVDTAGLEEAAVESLPGRMRLQSEAAMAQSDAVFFLVDVRTGVTPTDRALANLVRKSGKPTVLVANKSGAARRPRARPMRSVSATRSRFPPSIMKVSLISTTRSAPLCRSRPRSRMR
jgi:GTP-binding protein